MTFDAIAWHTYTNLIVAYAFLAAVLIMAAIKVFVIDRKK